MFEGSKFAVDRVTLTRNDGGTTERELVVHPGAVAVLPIMDDGRVVMIRNERFAVGEELWELCAGTLEAGEDPRACAGRELIEETGYEAATIEPLVLFYTSPGVCTERMYTFVARGLKHVGQQLEPTEKIRVEPVSWDELIRLCRDGEVRDAKTLAAVLYYQAFADPGGER